MGLFNKKARVDVFATAVNLVDTDQQLEEASVIRSVLREDETITEGLLISQLNGPGLRLKNAYNYGRSSYTYGLPDGHMEVAKGDDTAVKTVLEALHGQTVVILNNVIDRLYPEFFARQFLTDHREWDSTTNRVSKPLPGSHGKVYFTGAVHTDPSTLQLTYAYDDVNDIPRTQAESIPVAASRKDSFYYLVNYQLLDAQGEPEGKERYWYYAISSNTYPALRISSTPVFSSPFYPIVPLRRNNSDMTHSSKAGTELYKTSKMLCETAGFSFAALGESINSNPSVDDIDHAYLFFGLNLGDDDPLVLDYLFDFFSYMEGLSTYGQGDFNNWSPSHVTDYPPVNKLRIADGGMNIELVYNYITSEVKTGNIGGAGTVTRELDIQTVGQFAVTEYYGKNDQPRQNILFDWERSRIILRKQTGTNAYTETVVAGLMHINYVYGNHTIETTLADLLDDEKDNFIIPLNQFVVEDKSLQWRNAFLPRCAHLLFNSVVITKTKWYQTGFFRFVILVVGIMITVSTVGADGGMGATMATGMGLTAGTTAFAIAAITLDIAIGILITRAFTVLVKELGIESSWAATLIMVAAVVISVSYNGGLKGAPFADQLLMAVPAMTQGITANVQDQLDTLITESNEFWKVAEGKTESLENAAGLLETNDIIDPFEFINSAHYFNPDETSEEFYNRTIHSGNVGILGLDAIHSYVDLQLALPQPRNAYLNTTAGNTYGY